MAADLTSIVAENVRKSAAGTLTAKELNLMLRFLAKWRSHVLQASLVKVNGTEVLGGPFAGMNYLERAVEGCSLPKLMGCYEQPLMPAIERAITSGYDTVLNIGCSEGYYAIGLARRMPNARVIARDISERGRAACAELTRRNGLEARIEIGGEWRHSDFAALAGRKVLVLCDIEGAEQELLDPVAAPALAGFDLVVELHEREKPGTTELLRRRFSGSHEIEIVQDRGERLVPAAPPWFSSLGHMDQLLAVWEWRMSATPWMIARARNRS